MSAIIYTQVNQNIVKLSYFLTAKCYRLSVADLKIFKCCTFIFVGTLRHSVGLSIFSPNTALSPPLPHPHTMLLSSFAVLISDSVAFPSLVTRFHLSAGITIKNCQEVRVGFFAQLRHAGRLRAPCNAQVCFYYSC